MADLPFFRGRNRTDCLVALLIQTACDYGSDADVMAAAACLGPARVTRHPTLWNAMPSVYTVETADHLFVVSASTYSALHWVGNVLGSGMMPADPLSGHASMYFLTVAKRQLALVSERVQAAAGSKAIVLIGFSLGAVSVTLLKGLLSRVLGIESACFAFASPRPGDAAFAAGFPTANYTAFAVVNDPVPSLPPVVWSGLGRHNAWSAFPPFCTYTHVSAGGTLFLDGRIDDGYSLVSMADFVLAFDTGRIQTWHNQPLYARLLRSRDLPDALPDGFDDFPFASKIDQGASTVFSYSQIPWRWQSPAVPQGKVDPMTVQLAFYIRDKASPPKGFQEVYYFAGTDLNAQIYQATEGPLPWDLMRAKFLSSSCEIYAVRASNIGSPKKSRLKRYITPLEGLAPATDTIEACIAGVGSSDGFQVKRQFHFRGIASSWIAADNLTALGQANLPKIFGSPNGFLPDLITGGLVINTYGPGNITKYSLTGAAQTAQSLPITLTFSPNVSIQAGKLVEIRGCKEQPLLNGRWMVVGASAAGQVILGGSHRYTAPPSISGKIYVVDPFPVAIARAEYSNIATKKTGRPAFLQRGRRSPQLRHR